MMQGHQILVSVFAFFFFRIFLWLLMYLVFCNLAKIWAPDSSLNVYSAMEKYNEKPRDKNRRVYYFTACEFAITSILHYFQ